MNDGLRKELRAELDRLAARGLRRTAEPQAAGSRPTDFTSNDYLGLAVHAGVLEASANALAEFGAGARASRLLGGGSAFEQRAEDALANWIGCEAALLFATGYQANLGLVATLAENADVLLCDAQLHASMIDACRLTHAQRKIFAHGDLEQLAEQLTASKAARRRYVLIESVDSMDGDVAPLAEILELCEQHDAWALVDEAHAIGVCGPRGAGLVASLPAKLRTRVLARVMTGGKALGCSGGFVAGSKELRELLVHRARSFIFSTGIPPSVAAGLCAAIALAQAAEKERAQLKRNAQRLATALDLPTPPAAILPFVVGDNERAVALSSRLQAAGCEVRAVRPPTVRVGTARLRIVLHAHNTDAAIDALARQLRSEPRATREPAHVANLPRPVAIVGTDTDVGKTVVSALVALALSRETPATYWKPVQTGDDSDTRTVRRLTARSTLAFGTPRYEFPLPASPHTAAAAAEASIDFEVLVQALEPERQRAAPGTLVVELAGGLLVPYDDVHTQADWLVRTRPRIVLVARSGLGTLNHTMLTLEALRTRRLTVETLFLVGEPHAANRETLEQWSNVQRILEVPLFAPLDEQHLNHWLDQQHEILS